MEHEVGEIQTKFYRKVISKNIRKRNSALRKGWYLVLKGIIFKECNTLRYFISEILFITQTLQHRGNNWSVFYANYPSNIQAFIIFILSYFLGVKSCFSFFLPKWDQTRIAFKSSSIVSLTNSDQAPSRFSYVYTKINWRSSSIVLSLARMCAKRVDVLVTIKVIFWKKIHNPLKETYMSLWKLCGNATGIWCSF